MDTDATRRRVAAAVATLAIVAVGCAQSTEEPTRAASVQTLTIRADEYAYSIPTSIRPGFARIRFVNDGKQPHAASFLRRRDGASAADVRAAYDSLFAKEFAPEAVGKVVETVVFHGGFYAGPGETTQGSVELAAGDYVLISLEGEAQPDFTRGMLQAFTVTGAREPRPAGDDSPVEVEARDRSFVVPETLTAGPTTLRISATGGEPHELLLGRLKPGKKRADLLADIRKEAAGEETQGGADIFEEIGALAPISSGQSASVVTDLSAGDYFLACFFVDTKTGRPHAYDGMIAFSTVPEP